MRKKKTKREIYAVHPGFAMAESVVANLKRKTGRSLPEWERLLKASGPKNPTNWREWPRARHGLGTNTARFVAERAAGREETYDPETYVEALFASRPALRPIYEALLRFSLGLGKDVTVTPCKTIVPFRRKFVFAQVKPVSRTKIELGLALGNLKPTGPLASTGGFAKGDLITHKIPLSALSEFDGETRRWLRRAFELCPSAEKK